LGVIVFLPDMKGSVDLYSHLKAYISPQLTGLCNKCPADEWDYSLESHWGDSRRCESISIDYHMRREGSVNRQRGA
jgi:hypothetical protein